MSKPCQDSYSINFTSFPLMLAYHEKMRQESRWERTEVNHLTVAPLDKNSPLFGDRTSFAPAVSEDAIRDTADNLGLPTNCTAMSPIVTVKVPGIPLTAVSTTSVCSRSRTAC